MKKKRLPEDTTRDQCASVCKRVSELANERWSEWVSEWVKYRPFVPQAGSTAKNMLEHDCKYFGDRWHFLWWHGWEFEKVLQNENFICPFLTWNKSRQIEWEGASGNEMMGKETWTNLWVLMVHILIKLHFQFDPLQCITIISYDKINSPKTTTPPVGYICRWWWL